MRKHLSVLMLYVHSTLYMFLLLIFVMSSVQTVFFIIAFRSAGGLVGLNYIMNEVHFGIIFAMCFLLLCALLCLTGCEFGSKSGYTLSRLRISTRMVFLWQSVSNAGYIFLFWAAQIGIAMTFCGIYTAHYPQEQAAMLVFYSNGFLHSLFPLEETVILVRNIALLVALAVASACFPVRMRRRERPAAAIAVALICVVFFVSDKGSFTINASMSIVALAIAAYSAHAVCRKEICDE